MATSQAYEAFHTEALVNRAEPAMRRALLNALTAARSDLDLEALAKLLEEGRYEAALEMAVSRGLVTASEEHAALYAWAGRTAAAYASEALGITIGFDQVNERAVQFMREARFRYIDDFSAEQRVVVRQAMVDGIERGLNPVAQARNFRDSIGLTERQLGAVQNYRRALEGGSRDALTRMLRDHRFDSTVERAIADGRRLTPAQVDRMVERYSQRYLAYRAKTIARTEALRAVHAASDEAMQQMIDAGLATAQQVERTWITAGDERVRSSHAALNGTIRHQGEAWQAAHGTLRFPGDPDAPASETVFCRCNLATRILPEASEEAPL